MPPCSAAGSTGKSIALAPDIEKDSKALMERWRTDGTIRRLWAHDASVWTGKDEAKWLGWLDIVARERGELSRYDAFSGWVKSHGFTDAVVLGMGGSSLGPEVLAMTFGQAEGFPKLRILDSTDPAQVRRIEAAINVGKTLFIVSSKSGGTTEPNALMDYFFARVNEATRGQGRRTLRGRDRSRFVDGAGRKITRFRPRVYGLPSIGGRYSVLSPFGLVPAAAAGIDLGKLLESAASMVRACGPDVPPGENPGVQLGLASVQRPSMAATRSR